MEGGGCRARCAGSASAATRRRHPHLRRDRPHPLHHLPGRRQRQHPRLPRPSAARRHGGPPGGGPVPPPQVSHYTLHGHLGGVLLLATTGLGDTLVSVGADRVAKVAGVALVQVWRLQGRLVAPVRWLALAPGLTATCLSGEAHLLLATGARLQEVGPGIRSCLVVCLSVCLSVSLATASLVVCSARPGRTLSQVSLRPPLPREAPTLLRQASLGHGLLLDPVTSMVETPGMAVIATTRCR